MIVEVDVPGALSVVTEMVDDDKELARIIFELEKKYPRFKELSREAKILSVYYMMDSGKVRELESVKRFLYKRDIVPIEEFLTAPYIGDDHIFYPRVPGVGHVWYRALCEIFAKGSNIREVILTGAIGTAKTSVSKIIHFYNTYRVTSLRFPQLVMGSVPGKWMNLQLMSVTMGKAQSTLLDPFKVLLRSSSAFVEVDSEEDFLEFDKPELESITPWIDAGNSIVFPNKVRITYGSRDHHALGEDLYGASLDEAEFRIVMKSVDQVFETYSQMVERIRSRFMYSGYTMATLVSSVASETGVISSYVKSKMKSGDSHTKIYSHSIWEVRFPGELERGKWYVLRGTKHHPSKVLSEEEVKSHLKGELRIPSGCEVIEIPERFLPDFKSNVERALRNLAGVVTYGDEQLVPELDHVVDDRVAPEVTVDLSLGEKRRLLDILKKNKRVFSVDICGNVRFARYPDLRRYVHMDLAETTEAALCIVHKERESRGRRLLVVPDLILRITTPDRIPLSKVSEFIEDLKNECGVRFQALSADQYQSSLILQKMILGKVASRVKRLSVDLSIEPYRLLGNMIFEGRVRLGRCPVLFKQLRSLYFDGKTIYTKERKDMADALCGAVYLAELETSDAPTEVFGEEEVRRQSIDLSKLEAVGV